MQNFTWTTVLNYFSLAIQLRPEAHTLLLAEVPYWSLLAAISMTTAGNASTLGSSE
jgi:hypothetical protein